MLLHNYPLCGECKFRTGHFCVACYTHALHMFTVYMRIVCTYNSHCCNNIVSSNRNNSKVTNEWDVIISLQTSSWQHFLESCINKDGGVKAKSHQIWGCWTKREVDKYNFDRLFPGLPTVSLMHSRSSQKAFSCSI